jgi:hypothetical protein
MAYVGTVSIVDEHGEALVTRRYATPACDEPTKLVARMTADVRAAVKRNPNLTVGTVQDGAPEMWTLTRDGLARLRQQGVISRWASALAKKGPPLLTRRGPRRDRGSALQKGRS